MNIKTQILKNTGLLLEDTIPSILYHATYKPLLNNIKKNGLNSKLGKKTYPDSKQGYIYLSKDKNVAESYAETSDIIPEEWLDEIIILKINTKNLSKDNFSIDDNVLDNKGDTIKYKGIIPWSEINT